MRIPDTVKSFLVGFPIVMLALLFVGFMVSKMGPAGLLACFFLFLAGIGGVILGDKIRKEFKWWR